MRMAAMKKEWSVAIANFEDNLKALPKPEDADKAEEVLAWNLYAGLSLIAQALHDEFEEIQQRLTEIEERLQGKDARIDDDL